MIPILPSLSSIIKHLIVRKITVLASGSIFMEFIQVNNCVATRSMRSATYYLNLWGTLAIKLCNFGAGQNKGLVNLMMKRSSIKKGPKDI